MYYTKKAMASITLILALLLSTMFAYGEQYITYAAEDTMQLTEWKVSGRSNQEYNLKIEKDGDQYVLPIPNDLIGTAGSKLTISAPEGYTGEYSVTYDSFSVDQYDGIEKTVASQNSTVELKDYFYSYDAKKKYIYTKQIELKTRDEKYEIVLKPYCGLDRLGTNRPNKKVSDTEWYATAVKGSKYTISPQGYCGATVTVNGQSDPVQYTAEDGTKSFNIEVSYTGEDAKIESRTYTLNLETIENDYTPSISYPKNVLCKQDAEVWIQPTTTETDTKYIYRWEYKGSGAFQPIPGETTSKIKVDTSRPAMGVFNQYRVTVTNVVDGIEYSVSYTFKINVNGEKVETPEILQQPISAEYVAGQKAKALSVQVDGTPGGKLTYQWYSNTENKNTKGNQVPGATKASFVPPVNTAGTTYYYCEIFDTFKGTKCKNPAVTDCAKIEVKPVDLGMEGKGTETEPYQIKSLQDLQSISSYVNKGFTFADAYFQFKEDVTLPADWDPIGSTKDGSGSSHGPDDAFYGTNLLPFSGIIDGKDGDTIHTVTIAENGKPLLDYVREATVRNLNIYGTRINGAGLVNHYAIDYGEDGLYRTGVPETILIDNVTLKSGSSTKKAGLISGEGSGANTIMIQNCKVESGVTIGYDKNEWQIGSFADTFNGRMINCSSAADVYGRESVGGLIGRKGQAMGSCTVRNSSFTGTVTASRDKAGGIIGSGYGAPSAPNTPVVSIQNCYVSGTISGNNWVGGILGAEPVCENCWANGSGSISSNCFYGKVNAKGDACGAIVGFLRSYDKYQGIENNYFVDNCGAEKAIGKIQEIIYTSHPKYGAEYGIEEGSFDENSGGISVNEAQLKDSKTIAALNSGAGSLKNWIQDTTSGYPVLSSKPIVYQISISGSYKKDYYVGDAFSTTGMNVTGTLTDGSTKELSLSDCKFSGFDSSKAGNPEITVSYGAAKAAYTVTVRYAQPENVPVTIRILGDTAHGEPTAETGTHTLSGGGLTIWVSESHTDFNQNNTVWDVIQKALAAHNMTCSNPSGNYIESITRDGVTLGEFSNGNLSGWMYTLNGTHPELGVSEQFIKKGDVIVLHYTDNYKIEEGSDKWDVPVETTQPVVQDAPATVGKDGEAVSKLTASDVDKLVDAAAKQSAATIEINVKGADKADKVTIELPKTSVSNIANKTDAELRVTTPAGIMTMDKQAMKEAVKAASGSDLTIALNKQDIAGASKEPLGSTAAQTKVSILSGGKEIKDLGTAKVKILLPVSDAMKDKAMAAATVDEDGKLTKTEGKLVTAGGKTYYQIETSKPGTFVVAESANIDAAIKQQAEENNTEKLIGDVKATTIKLKSKLNKRSIKLTWTKSADTEVDGYQIYRSIKKSAGYKKYATTKKLTYTNKARLKKGTRYYYKVRGYKVIDGKNYYTQWSNKANRKMKANSLDYGVKKTTVKAKAAASKGAVKLTWTKSKGYKVDGYQVYRSANKTKNFKKLGTTAKKTFKNTKTLKKGKTYYYKVRGYRVLDGKKVYTKWSKTISVKAK